MSGEARKLKTLHRLRPSDITGLLGRDGKHNDGGSLYLQVRRGAGAWIYEHRDGNARRSRGLGSYPAVTLAMARKARADILHGNEIAPRRSPSTSPARKLFGDMTAPYLENHRAEWGAEQFTRNGAILRLHAAALNKRPCDQISVEEVADALRPIWKGPGATTGSQARGLIEKVLSAAGIERNPAAWSRLRDHLSTKTVKSTPHASLPYAELPALMAEFAANPAEAARALRFLILTGVRQKEALGAKWQEINLAARLWTIPAERMKVKDVGDHVVPLSDAAIACLGQPGAKGDFIFPSKRGGAQMRANDQWHLLQTYKRIDPLLNKPITIHGFRTTLSTWAQEQKPPFPEPVIDRALAHVESNKTRAAYLRSTMLDERRNLADQWAIFATTPSQ